MTCFSLTLFIFEAGGVSHHTPPQTLCSQVASLFAPPLSRFNERNEDDDVDSPDSQRRMSEIGVKEGRESASFDWLLGLAGGLRGFYTYWRTLYVLSQSKVQEYGLCVASFLVNKLSIVSIWVRKHHIQMVVYAPVNVSVSINGVSCREIQDRNVAKCWTNSPFLWTNTHPLRSEKCSRIMDSVNSGFPQVFPWTEISEQIEESVVSIVNCPGYHRIHISNKECAQVINNDVK